MPTHRYLIGVDLGTSSTKAGLYRTDGSLVAEAVAEVPILYPKSGVVEQENEDFYQTASETVRTVIEQSGIEPRDIAAIAFDSQMAGVGSINEDFKPATRFDSWLDMRCEPYIDYLSKNHRDRITELTGCAPTCDHGPKMMWWKNERPELYANVAKFVMPSTFVAGKMVGLRAEDAFIDHTFLHFTTLADASKGEWSDELIEILGLSRDKLPRIVEPWYIVGEVTDAAAKQFGLAPGTPVAAGCGDTAAGALGAGVVRPGMVFDVAGTAAVLAASTDTFVSDVKHHALLTMRSVIPDLWHPLAYIAGGGQAIVWYRDQFFNALRGESQVSEDDVFLAMAQYAESAPAGAEGLFFSPHLGGRICPATPEMRGAWVGFSLGHTQAHFSRSVLESIAYEYAFYLSALRDAIPGLQLHETRVIGGGARSDFWNQIKADVLRVSYQRLNRTEFGTWGAAMIAGKAVGIYDDLAEVAMKHAQPAGDPFVPDPEHEAVYDQIVSQYIRLQTTLTDTFDWLHK
ncbi:MAG: FGGY family carbohydrate kinase [Chloroflexota bacterium]